MKFKSIELENFLSFGEKQKIDFISNDVVLVLGINEEENGGSNGAGKTSILNGIVWALYGKTTKELSADSVVNNKIGQDCKVTLELFKDKKHILIKRYRKLNGKKNKLQVFINGKDVSRSNVADSQKIINDIIKINFRSFISSVMFSQDRVFNFTVANSQKRKEIIENVLQVDNLAVYERLFKTELSKLIHSRDEINYKVKNYQELINSLIQSNKDYIQSCKIKQNQFKNKLKNYQSELNEISKIDIAAELEKLKSNKKLLEQISKLEPELKVIQQKIAFSGKQIKEKIGLSNREKKEIKSLDTSLKKALENPKMCPLCGNIIDKDVLDKYVQDVKSQIKNLKKSFDKTSLEIEELEKNLNEDYLIKEKSLKNKIGKLKNKIQDLTVSEGELEHLNEKKKELERNIETTKQQMKHVVDETYIEKIKEQALEAKKNMKKEQKKLKELEDDIIHYTFWTQAFSKGENTIRSFLISKVINFLNSRVNYYLNMFFERKIKFSLDVEMNHHIQRDDIEISMQQLSGGEEQRINLAIAFSLFDLVKMNLGSDIDIIFLDEVLDKNLDDNGINALLKIIEDLKERHNAIYVISHKDNFKSYFTRSMIVYKGKDGFSKILSG